jgi:arginyl-tRNA synthetase
VNIKQELEKRLQMPVSVSEFDGVDFQCNECLKRFDLDAQTIADRFNKDNADFAKAFIKNKFINFILSNKTLTDAAHFILREKKLPLAAVKPQKVFFDYGGANIAKAMHIGHLRSAIIGEALKRLFEDFGHTTVSDVYLGDWGLQMGLVIAYLLENKLDIDGITLNDLNEIYPAASKLKDESERFYNLASDITARLQKLEQPYYGIWERLRKISLTDIRKNYELLNCTFDYYNGESSYQKYTAEVLEKLRPYTNLSDGALIIEVGLNVPMILQKRNGGNLYATSDVAAIYARAGEFTPDRFIYITDSRQAFHFKQLFSCAKIGKLVGKDTELTHIPYGSINDKDGRPFKTREGGTIKFSDVITGDKIQLAAVKFADFINNVRKDYIFDLDKATMNEGKTGVYLLYTLVRIKSILSKAGKFDIDLDANLIDDDTRKIFTSIIKLAESYTIALNTLTLNNIADGIYDLAAAFSSFYANRKILKEEDGGRRNFYLSICLAVKTALEFGLKTLAITFVDKM